MPPCFWPCIQIVFSSGSRSVNIGQRQQQHHLGSCQKCKFLSFQTSGLSSQGVGPNHVRLTRALKVGLRCAKFYPQPLPLGGPDPAASPGGFFRNATSPAAPTDSLHHNPQLNRIPGAAECEKPRAVLRCPHDVMRPSPPVS